MSCSICRIDDIEEILASCYSLQKLALDEIHLTQNMINSIGTQNGQTLETLSLRLYSCQDLSLTFIQQIIEKCIKLKEISIGNFSLPKSKSTYLPDNLPTRIEKLEICGDYICDQTLQTLFVRCTNLKSFCLKSAYQITNDSVTSIIDNLKHSLEELELPLHTMILHKITPDKLLELKSMPNLRVLNCGVGMENEIEILKNNMPHLTINSRELKIGPEEIYDPNDGLWEIPQKPLEIFQKHECRATGRWHLRMA